MKLEVVIFKKLSEYDLDVCFESHEDRLGLMGPSGSGKSMVLKCIAGIMTPDAGRIVLDDEVLFDSDLKINISPQKRKIGYMYQKSTENKTCYLFNEKVYRLSILYSILFLL